MTRSGPWWAPADSRRRGRGTALAVAALGVGLGLVAELVSYGSLPSGLTAADFAAGCALVVCGAIAWERRSESRVGPLLALAGVAWFLGTMAAPFAYLNRGPLVHAQLSYPTGRARGRLTPATIGLAYIAAVVPPIGASPAATVALAALVAAAAAREFARATGPARRARAVSLATALAFAAVLAFGALYRGGGDAALWLYDAVVATVAVVLAVDLLRSPWEEAVVTGLVVELGAAGEPERLRGKLARALGDPSLVIAYRLPATGRFVDDEGRAVAVPPADPARRVVPIEDEGEQLAVLVVDRDAPADRELLDGVAAAARIAVSNARLEAEAHARTLELEDSRRRIVEAADAQRRRLERDLRLGAERRLDRVAALVAEIRGPSPGDDDALASFDSEVASAVRELEELAQGVHPAALIEGGLVPALAVLAGRSPIPVAVAGGLGRLPPAVEAALYFVCSEALTNATKHAAASRVAIALREEPGRATVTVADDGRGGADPGRGSGLRGLRDRIEALGGRFDVDSPRGGGTRLVVDVPTSPV